MILGSDTVTILRGQSRDRFGDLSGTGTATGVDGCAVQPGASSESTDRGELLITRAIVYLPPGTDILATDRVEWLGTVYEVDGAPDRWRDYAGTESHVQVQLKLVQGQG